MYCPPGLLVGPPAPSLQDRHPQPSLYPFMPCSRLTLRLQASPPMSDDRFEKHELRDQKLRDLRTRIDGDGRVGWLAVALTAVVAAVALLAIAYMALYARSSLTK
jgi:hypothetical protein